MLPPVKIIKEFPPTVAFPYDEALWRKQHANAFVIINCKASSIYYPEHWTPLSIKCAFKGREFYKLSNTTYSVTDDRFLLLNEGNHYASFIESERETESFTLNFTPENIEALVAFFFTAPADLLDDPFFIKSGGLKVFEKLYSHDSRTLGYVRTIQELTEKEYTDEFQLTELLYFFLEELISLHHITQAEIDLVDAKKKSTREEIYKRLNIARDYMQSCYVKDISLDHLSRICFLNAFHLLREFKKYFHITPHKYLTQVRLKEAEKLISGTDLSVMEVIGQVGFQDLSSFSKLFKSHFGNSPHTYRHGLLVKSA
jgi:AraC family transcriptional regulator